MAIKGKEELKKLNTLQVKLQSEIEAIKIEREILNNKLQSAERNLGKIQEEIKKLKEGNKIIVSEHAMLRYIERVLGINLKEIEKRILTDEVKEQYKIVGNGRFPINDEFRALIRDNVVVTITGVEKNKQ
jgi:hypothetical protein